MSSTDEPKTYHHGDLRASLIAAAVELIREEGESALTLRQVARRAGVSHAAPYRHFKDRAALVSAVASEGFRRLATALQEAAVDLPPGPKSLTALGVAYVQFALDHPGHFRVMFSSEARSEETATSSRGAFAQLSQVLEAGQAAQLFRPDKTETKTLTAWCLVHGLAMLLNDGRIDVQGAPAIEALTRQVTGCFQEGVLQPDVDFTSGT